MGLSQCVCDLKTEFDLQICIDDFCREYHESELVDQGLVASIIFFFFWFV